MAKKTITTGVFDWIGLQTGWKHPSSQGVRYRELDFWVEKVRLLEELGYDFLFLADTFDYRQLNGTLDPVALRAGIGFPRYDPTLYVSAMAAATERLGFVVTGTTGLDHPLQTARTFGSLDQLSKGRVAWNIVTGAGQHVMAELFGHAEMAKHDDRYRKADEYVEVALEYWEGGWDDDALNADTVHDGLADPAKVHLIEHVGEYYRSRGYLSVDPTPQRTPVLFQAGTSEAGKQFAARNAECVFVGGDIRANIADIRERAARLGRADPGIRFFSAMNFFVAATHDEAEDLSAEFDALQTDEQAAAWWRGRTGIDLLPLDRDKPLTQLPPDMLRSEVAQTAIDLYTRGEYSPTVQEILDIVKKGNGVTMVGTAEEVADELEALVDETDLDGVMVTPVFDLASLRSYGELVIPELRRRGRIVQSSGPTLREKLFDRGARLPLSHRGAAFRSIGDTRR